MKDDVIKKEAKNLLYYIDEILTSNELWYSLAYGSALGAVREHGFIEWDHDIDIVIQYPDQNKVREVLKKNLPPQYIYLSSDKDTVAAFDCIHLVGVHPQKMHIDLYPLVGGPQDLKKQRRYQTNMRIISKIVNCKYDSISNLKKKWKIPFVCFIKCVEYLFPNRLIRSFVNGYLSKYPFYESKLLIPVGNNGNISEYMPREVWLETIRTDFEGINLPIPRFYVLNLSNIYGSDYMTPKRF